MEDSYVNFLKTKKTIDSPSGFDWDNLPSELFDFQAAIVKWALKRGRAAIFADTGLGKTYMQLAWADAVHQFTGNRVLIVAPLCVSQQTVDESHNLDVRRVKYVREMPYKETGVFITNYEMLDNFEFESNYFDGIVLDESSILKHQDSKTRTKIINKTLSVPYKLSCTATPSPNDHMELASQSEFLGIMDASEMLSMFFTHDSGETSKWRLKGHAAVNFWEWLASWAVYIKKPSDIGFSDDGYDLPPLNLHKHIVETDHSYEDFTIKNKMGLSGRNKARRATIEQRVKYAAEIANNTEGPMVIWCNLNDESKMLTESINDSAEVKGSDSIKYKESTINDFSHGNLDKLITKPKIAGFGMNWQHCNNMIFVGLNDSYEQLYQAIRRCYRFGQKKEVNAHLIISDVEQDTLENLENKEKKVQEMQNQLCAFMKDFQTREVMALKRETSPYIETLTEGNNFKLYNADCVEACKKIPDNSVDFSIFSPPFSSLYTYSNSDRDIGNCKDDDEFWNHFSFLIPELHRIMRPGRNISIHLMNLPSLKSKHGYIGIRDFRGDMIRAFQAYGFIFHSEVTIWKNPVVAMQRTKALGLLWKQIKKNSAMSRQGLPDYVVTFRKNGECDKPVEHTAEQFPVHKWQELASPCWMDIKQSNTLNGKLAREESDERHIAPLQLDLIERCLDLWSIPGDTVFSPFAGIGSEGYVSLLLGRKFIGSELKKSYYDVACKNLKDVDNNPKKLWPNEPGIFDTLNWSKDDDSKIDNPQISYDITPETDQMSIFDLGV